MAEDAVPARGLDRRRLLVRLGVVAGAVVFALYLALWAGLVLVVKGGTDGADYTAFYTGWTIVADGDGARLYDPAFQADVQQRILSGRTFEAGLNPFNNPPHLVLPFLPLVALPLTTSYLVWGAIHLGLLAWLIWRLVTRVGGTWSRDERVLAGRGLARRSAARSRLAAGVVLAAGHGRVVGGLTSPCGPAATGRPAAWLVVASVKPQAVLTTGVALLAGASLAGDRVGG